MKAVIFRGIGDIRIDTVPDPEAAQATDAAVSVLTRREPADERDRRVPRVRRARARLDESEADAMTIQLERGALR
ncbi:hypothetical protein [Burkholderia ambifaria]|uniref:hypothetical protein n=1 Tax=Burkholderia ambifaria TaxID=152480 RepID=UPI001FC847BF|nr:hypothetical protein [Burkholderia ambifaria]